MCEHPWFLVDSEGLANGATVCLASGEARHAAGARRLRCGDGVVVIDGAGAIGRGFVCRIARRRVEVELRHVERLPRTGDRFTLALAVLHGRGMDWAVQKAVEVGVQRLMPVITGRCQVVRGAAARRAAHWRRVARQALKQCRRAWQMEVDEPLSLVHLVEFVERDTERRAAVADRDGMWVNELTTPPNLLLVGPEGGLEPAEIELVASSGWQRVRLGHHVLRAETAAVVGASAMLMRNR